MPDSGVQIHYLAHTPALSCVRIEMTRDLMTVGDGAQEGLDLRADGLHKGTTGMEPATRGRIERAWNLTGDDDLFSLFIRVRRQRRGKECLGIGMQRLMAQITARR